MRPNINSFGRKTEGGLFSLGLCYMYLDSLVSDLELSDVWLPDHDESVPIKLLNEALGQEMYSQRMPETLLACKSYNAIPYDVTASRC